MSVTHFAQNDNYYRHIIVPEGGENRVAMKMIVSRIQTVLLQRGA
jgi:hypothetical protein